MAIAFRPPEIQNNTGASAAAAPAQVHYQPQSSQQQHLQGVTVQGPTTPTSTTGGIVILSPSSSAVIQHHGLWVTSPQCVVHHHQQQMFTGFPPIYHNNTAAPQFHRVAYAAHASAQRTPHSRTTTCAREVQRCVTGCCCPTCSDTKRGELSYLSPSSFSSSSANPMNKWFHIGQRRGGKGGGGESTKCSN